VLSSAVSAAGAAVVQAPPGSGKTTLVPPALAAGDLTGGRVVVTQPRRIAARAAARRLASLLGEPVGGLVGCTVRGERQTSPRTRVEFVTTGVLLRRLQRDPELPGVSAVVLDEVHERHLDADLALALLVDVRRHLRDDLVLVAMSATVEAARTAALIGEPGAPAPVVSVDAALHPVAVQWRPAPPRVQRTDERGVTPRSSTTWLPWPEKRCATTKVTRSCSSLAWARSTASHGGCRGSRRGCSRCTAGSAIASRTTP
jgi:ATP-dependent helicase HrpB